MPIGNRDAGAGWRASYGMRDFEGEIEHLWRTLKPLYQNIHFYVKRKLKKLYADRDFPQTGHIPAHLLGNIKLKI